MVGDNYQDNGGLFPTEFVKSGASRLLAPVCVGTVDQAILGSLPTKFNHLRLLALANAHVVIDEVHTLDAYQSELLEDLLHWWAATHTPHYFSHRNHAGVAARKIQAGLQQCSETRPPYPEEN